MELYKFFLLFCFLALVALQQSVTALPIPRSRLPAPAPKLDLPQKCPIHGSSELYGLGVRLGLYFQWLSTMLLRYRRSWGRKSTVRGITNLTCVSLFISLVTNLANDTSLSIDYLIVYYLTVVMFYAESYTWDRIFSEEIVYVPAVDKAQLYREHGCKSIPVPGDLEMEEEKEMGLRLRADFPLVFQNGLSVAQSVLATWFWAAGLSSIPGFPCMTLEAAAILGVFPLRAHPWQRFATFAAVASSAIFSLLFYIHVQDIGLDKPYALLHSKGRIPARTSQAHRCRLQPQLGIWVAVPICPLLPGVLQRAIGGPAVGRTNYCQQWHQNNTDSGQYGPNTGSLEWAARRYDNGVGRSSAKVAL
ncbi:hypothetical protein TWF569_004683 [Orbilia oligospora]|nr:hypothetical protein TWF569_004683 [Orbilia oligospora]